MVGQIFYYIIVAIILFVSVVLSCMWIFLPFTINEIRKLLDSIDSNLKSTKHEQKRIYDELGEIKELLKQQNKE